MSAKVSEQTQPVEKTPEAPNGEDKVPCEVYSRIVGYVRPVRNWNKGKQQEFAERQTYRVEEGEAEKAPEPECEGN